MVSAISLAPRGSRSAAVRRAGSVVAPGVATGGTMTSQVGVIVGVGGGGLVGRDPGVAVAVGGIGQGLGGLGVVVGMGESGDVGVAKVGMAIVGVATVAGAQPASNRDAQTSPSRLKARRQGFFMAISRIPRRRFRQFRFTAAPPDPLGLRDQKELLLPTVTNLASSSSRTPMISSPACRPVPATSKRFSPSW